MKKKHVVVGNARHVPMLAFHRDFFAGVQKWTKCLRLEGSMIAWNDTRTVDSVVVVVVSQFFVFFLGGNFYP